LVGRRLQLNPMLVFLALWFGALFWGIPGIVLATPALATLKVIAENSIHGKQLLDFLSPDGRADRKALARSTLAGAKAATDSAAAAGSAAVAAPRAAADPEAVV
jgi:hypothetical protein